MNFSISITLGDFLLSIISSVIASTFFIFLILHFLRPKIKISPYIAVNSMFSEGGNPVYFFKIINLSLFTAYDLSMELWAQELYPVKNGMNSRFIELPLRRKTLSYVPEYKLLWKSKKYGDFAILASTNHNIRETLANPHHSIRLQVTLRHGLTGLSKVFYLDYANESVIKQGIFTFGNSFEI